MKKLLGLAIAGLISIGLAAIGTWAYFSDVEYSNNSQLTAGTLDLKTNDADGITQTLYTTAMKPGDTAGPNTISLRNAGLADGATLEIDISYVESDGSPNAVNKSADETAAMMEVTTLNYGGSSILGSVSDSNLNGYKDMQDLKNASLVESGLNASATKNFQISVQLRSGTGNDYQADGVTVTMAFVLSQ
jgi:predicted ribosomally synthesized peptide with SipW-like signal peptide